MLQSPTPFLLSLLALGTVANDVCSAQTLPSVWDRDADWVVQPDSSAGTTLGNPSPDAEGNLVWHYEYTTTGGDLGSADPWYDEAATPLVWDTSWFGQEGVWAVGDNFGAVVRPRGMTHVGEWFGFVPIVRWKNVTGQAFEVGITGSLWLTWNGNSSKATPVDVDVVIAHRDGGTGALTLLHAVTVSKPTDDDTPEVLVLPIDLAPLAIGAGDEILWTHQSYDSKTNGRWVSLVDAHLCLVRDPIGTRYCGPGVPNSSGLSGQIAASGFEQVASDELTLKAFQLPTEQFGFFLASMTQGFIANPGGSDGNLCLGGAIGRFVGPGQILNSGSGGAMSLEVDLQSIPTSQGPVQVHAGETWNFQLWHRDAAGTSNFTDAIGVTFR